MHDGEGRKVEIMYQLQDEEERTRLRGWNGMARHFAVVVLILTLVLGGAPVTAMAQQPSQEDLSYGFFMVRADEYLEQIPAANTQWTRMAGVSVWGLVELVPGSGDFNFIVTDPIIQEANDLNIQLLLNINQVHPDDAGAFDKALPTDMDGYKAFVTAFVERYDGDGVDDAPSSPVVKYWQIGNEPDNETDLGEKIEWNDTPENFALFVKETADCIRLADPTATILLGGLAKGLYGLQNFYDPMFTTLDGYGGGPYFDVFDVHWFGQVATNDYIGLDSVVPEINSMLDGYGYTGTPIWVTETATYSDTPEGLVLQTEDEQARDLARRLLHYRCLGMEKVFWTPLKEFHEWKGVPNHYFDNTGLINNELNDGDSSEKKAYYTYLLLASKLDGAIVQSDGPFMQQLAASVAKGGEFTNYGKTYYAIWVDNPAHEGAMLSFPTDYDSFTVYSVVPDESNVIQSEVVEAVDGYFEYPLSLDPILIEYSGLDITYPVRNASYNTPTIAVEGVVEIDPEVTFENPPSGSPVSVMGSGIDGSFTFPGETFPEGLNTIHLTAQDALGNLSEVYLDFIIDTEAPEITAMTQWGNALEEYGPFTVTATITDSDVVVSPKLIYTIDSGSPVEVLMSSLGDDRWGGEIPSQPMGTSISYYTTASDTAGNVSVTTTVTFQIISPVVSWLIPMNTGLFRGALLDVNLNIKNYSFLSRTYNVKIEVTLPNATKKVLNNVNIPMDASELRSDWLQHGVPPRAPIGAYMYTVTISDLLGVELARAEFPVMVYF
jgi:hypothetical protein